MPSSQTITSFYTFVQNTKARASQVNNNFDVIRGHFIPIHASTQTSANNTYDLGSTEYNWRKGYMGELYLGATSTSWSLKDATTTGGGNLIFYRNSVEKFRIGEPVGFTSTSLYGQIAYSGGTALSSFLTTSAINIAGTTVTVDCIGTPIELFFDTKDATQDGPNISIDMATAGSGVLNVQILFCRNTSTSIIRTFRHTLTVGLTSTADVFLTQSMSLDMRAYDRSPPVGINNYFIRAGFNETGTGDTAAFLNYQLCAKHMS